MTTVVGVAGKRTGLGNYLLINGTNVSGDINSISKLGGGLAATEEMTDITQSAIERQAGLRDGGIGWISYFNPAANRAHAIFSALPRTDVHAMVLFGQALGEAGAGIVAKQLDYAGTREQSGAFRFTVEGQGNGFGLEHGVQATPGIRSDTTATNGASIDYGAAVGTTAFGLQMYVQLLSFTGTSITIKVQSSTDDGGGDAFADITAATTGALTTPAGVRVATAVNASVERYLRVVTTGTFSAADFAVVVCRNSLTPAF